MSKLVRISFSIEESLFHKLEKMVAKSNYANRSEFIRDLVRNKIVEKQWDKNCQTFGTITLIYDHLRTHLSHTLTHLQHEHYKYILATTHVHLNKDLCSEVILIKGRAKFIQQIFDSLRQQKGVLHASLSMSSIGKDLT